MEQEQDQQQAYKILVNVGAQWLPTRTIDDLRRGAINAARKRMPEVEKAKHGLILIVDEDDKPVMAWRWFRKRWSHCAEMIGIEVETDIDSGATFECLRCAGETIVDLFTSLDRAQLYRDAGRLT